MTLSEKTGLTGLVTNVAETQAPPGTLIEAENVVMRRPGCIEPRDGLQLAGTLASGFAAWGFSWRTKDFILRNNGSHTFDLRDTAGSTYRYTDPESAVVGDPQPLRRDIFSRAEARANLYLPNSAGVCKLETDSGPLKTVGIPHAFSLQSDAFPPSSSYGSWLPDGQQVAYRAVLMRKDANGVEIRSVPTGYIVFQNVYGVAAGCKPRIIVSSKIEWDACELYRTRNFPNAVRVDDEMQIVTTLPKSLFSAAGNALYYDYVDGIDPDLRGARLYTSPSQGGGDEQNSRPPAAALTALFRGSLFFANVRRAKQIEVSATFASAVISTSTGLGVRNYTANRTSGSNQLTSVSSTVGLEKGQIVNVGGFQRYITAISGSTVTVSGNSPTTSTGDTYSFYDAINIDGVWFQTAAVLGASIPQLAANDEVGVLVQSITPPKNGYNTTLLFEALLRDTATHTIQATHGSEYYPQLPNYDGTPLQLTQDTWPGAFMFSKTDEPEHVRPIDYEFVGDQNRAVLALIPTRDALYFVKEDGVFRLTGAAGVWRVDPFDPTARCVLPSSARALRSRGVFLGDRGVAMVSDDGVELVSAPVNDLFKPLIDQLVANWLSTGFYELPGMAGAATSCVFERESEYTIARGSTVPPLVYNDITGAWTTLAYYGHSNEAYAYKSLFNFERSGNCVLSLGTSYFKTLLSTDAGANYLRYDRATAVTVVGYATGFATLSAPVNALEDDVLLDAAGRYWRVTADVNNSVSIPIVLGGGTASMTNGAGTLYRSLRCSVTATGFAIPLGAQKHWQSFNTAWTKLVGPVRLRYAWESSEKPGFVEQDAYTSLAQPAVAAGTGIANYPLGLAPPARVPAASARAWLLRARIRWAMAHGDAQLEGISADLTPLLPGSKQQVAA